MSRRLAVITTHPIQYYAPVFRAMTTMGILDVRVFYTLSQAAQDGLMDSGFNRPVRWDVPLLDGYDHQFVPNVAKYPSTERFNGLHNPSLLHEVDRWAPDAVLVYTWNSRSHLSAMRHFSGRIPVFFRGDSTLLDPRPAWHNRLRRRVLTWVYSHIDVAIAVGSNNRDYFKWCGVPSQNIVVASHSIDVERFVADGAVHEERALLWRREMGIDEEAIVILFAGKLQAKKNPDLLLDAFGSLGMDAHLVFVGNGELEHHLQEKSRGIKRVHFLPFQNQSLMPAVYRLGDVFVLPSQGPGETWGLAMNEAMACGRPVIASDRAGGARDLIETGLNGWRFESGNLSQLAAVLCSAVLSGRSVLRRLGATAQLHSARWSSAESARRIVAAVASMKYSVG